MWIVARKTIPNRRGMHFPLDIRSFFICMAGDANCGRGRGDQLDAGHIFIDPDLVAGQAARLHCGMNGLSLGLILMAFEALGGIGLGVQRNRVNGGSGARGKQSEHGNADRDVETKRAAALAGQRITKPDALIEQSHADSDRYVMHGARRTTKRWLRVAGCA